MMAMSKLICAIAVALVACAPAPPPPKPPADAIVLRAVNNEMREGASVTFLNGGVFYYDYDAHIIDARDIDARRCSIEATPDNQWAVVGHLTPEGSRKFGKWTEANIGKQVGIFVDGRLVSAPTVRSKIEDTFMIEGGFTKMQAEQIVARLRTAGGR